MTGADQGESLSRYDFRQGDVVLVDRGYNHPATLIDLHEQEVGVVVRLLATAMPLYFRPAGQLESILRAEQRLQMAD